jgi:hypothetical protein
MDDIKIEQQKEFLRQLNREFKRLEDNLKDLKEELKNSIDEDPYTIVTFGLAKKAEQIAILTGQMWTLKSQEQNFKFIFEIKD